MAGKTVVLIRGFSQQDEALTIHYLIHNQSDKQVFLDLRTHNPSAYHLGFSDSSGNALDPIQVIFGMKEPDPKQTILASGDSITIRTKFLARNGRLLMPMIQYRVAMDGIYEVWFECDSSEGILGSEGLLFMPSVASKTDLSDKTE